MISLYDSNTFEMRFRHFKMSTKTNGKLDILTSRNRRSESFEKQMKMERKTAKMTKKSIISLYNSNTSEPVCATLKIALKYKGNIYIFNMQNDLSKPLVIHSEIQ